MLQRCISVSTQFYTSAFCESFVVLNHTRNIPGEKLERANFKTEIATIYFLSQPPESASGEAVQGQQRKISTHQKIVPGWYPGCNIPLARSGIGKRGGEKTAGDEAFQMFQIFVRCTVSLASFSVPTFSLLHGLPGFGFLTAVCCVAKTGP